MFARVSEWSVPPERQDEALRAAEEHIVPSLRMQSGYLGEWLFGDRENGRMLTVTLWETEEAMHATDEHAYWYRTFGAQDAGGRVESTRFFEVLRSENVSARRRPESCSPGCVGSNTTPRRLRPLPDAP
jgi:heme-degrading monooxygenase HmoA